MSVIKDNVTAKYFSVRVPLRIGDMRCIPSICYELRLTHRQTILDLVKKDQVILYEEQVKFISGKAYPRETAAPTIVKPSIIQATKAEPVKKATKSSSSSASAVEFPSEV